MAGSSTPNPLGRRVPESVPATATRWPEIVEELPESRAVGEEEEEKVYVALPLEVKEGKETLQWVLKNISADEKLVILHIHRPPQLIPMMGAMVPVRQLEEHRVRSYRQQERMKVETILDEYLDICSKSKFHAEKLVFEMNDVSNGIVELVARLGIAKLVMGAAADRCYSKKMTSPKSKTAIAVQQKAHLSCKIWFVCKGHLICTRDGAIDRTVTPESPSFSSSSRSSQSGQLRSMSLPQGQTEKPNWVIVPIPRSTSEKMISHKKASVLGLTFPSPGKLTATQSKILAEGIASVTNTCEGCLKRLQSSGNSSYIFSPNSGVCSSSSSSARHDDEESGSGSRRLPHLLSEEDLQFSSPPPELEAYDLTSDVYERLQEVHLESEKLKLESYKETCKRQKAESAAFDALRKAKQVEYQYKAVLKKKQEVDEVLDFERKDTEKVKKERDEYVQELQKARDRESHLMAQITDTEHVVKEFEEKLLKALNKLQSLRTECDRLKQERDIALQEAEVLLQKKGEASNRAKNLSFSVFTYSELAEATGNFDDSLKIGEGGYGSVFKGFLRHTMVAIKMLNSQGMQGQEEFHQEMEVLSMVRHPHLVTLIGTCPEAWALIYEYLPRRSLDDRLACKGNTPPLPWHVRMRIAAEICSALIFLHSSKPHGIVHGDLKPANILLDANFVSKLGDFGISRLLGRSNVTETPFWHTIPKGTLPYMDPEFVSSGDITLHSDVYSFGIILLHLLTGMPAMGIINKVKDAVHEEQLSLMLDSSAGNWPYDKAKQVVELALRCCETSRKNRPDLARDAWRVLMPMANMNDCGSSSGSVSQGMFVPSYFICPISKELMKDPQIAADGFSYEAEAIRRWFDSGHNTSPMTNLRFAHQVLIPNRALRCAIEEWK
ncbi:U-box domain-containing protein 33 [Apostasia shenzhenica]|uniref:RING-type E3 ubiquitin transferase n=1 Tax=Apostasia shenzhenica TaxID=1088818 RepID=A0A2I0AV03_9ASPA|nr:U-box domain-containing protein 33 [Apostasia shenzhenica]